MVWHKNLGPAQNILGLVKGQGIRRVTWPILPIYSLHIFEQWRGRSTNTMGRWDFSLPTSFLIERLKGQRFHEIFQIFRSHRCRELCQFSVSVVLRVFDAKLKLSLCLLVFYAKKSPNSEINRHNFIFLLLFLVLDNTWFSFLSDERNAFCKNLNIMKFVC